jgi:hypothetical protein
LSIKVESARGVLLSRSEISKDGFISSNAFSSHIDVPPVALTPLDPGQQVSRQVKLDDLLAGTQPHLGFDARQMQGKCLTFRLVVFTDKELRNSVSALSESACVE